MQVEEIEINGFQIENFNQHGLDVGKSQGTCPLCSSSRKPENRKAKCASYDWERGLGTCHNCDKTFQMHTYKRKGKAEREYVIPELNRTPVKSKAVEWFKTRGISKQTLDEVGGLDNLKLWLEQRSSSFSEKATNYGLPVPRGLLLVGVQGTGKSLTAKAIAHDWRLPLLRLDFGRLFAGIVGESESRVREMIRVAEALSPCIVWIDEIDKSFNQSEGKGDSGTTNRVLATFLTWLSEKTSQVFVVATANNFEVLPLELIRKGRFDEIFFVGLPVESERKQIFEVLLSQLRPDSVQDYDLQSLSKKAIDFSGAEIFQAIIEGMYIAFNENREFTTSDIMKGLNEIIPLAQLEKKKIQTLQQWALSGRIRTASSNF